MRIARRRGQARLQHIARRVRFLLLHIELNEHEPGPHVAGRCGYGVLQHRRRVIEPVHLDQPAGADQRQHAGSATLHAVQQRKRLVGLLVA